MNLLICFSLLTQLSQAINNSSVPTAVGKCKISIEKNKEKIYLFIFIYCYFITDFFIIKLKPTTLWKRNLLCRKIRK